MLLIVDGIVKYMRSKAGPSSKVLTSVAEAEKFLDNIEHSIVGNVLGRLVFTILFLLV